MDRIEITVRREDENAQKKDKLKYNLFLVVALCFFAYAVFSLLMFFAAIAAQKAALTDLIPVIIPAAAGIIFLVLRENTLVEYDYLVEDDVFKLAKIKNLQARKEIVSLPVSNFSRIEKYSRERFESLPEKKFSAVLNGEEKRYILFFTYNGTKCALQFEPTPKFIEEIKRVTKQ